MTLDPNVSVEVLQHNLRVEEDRLRRMRNLRDRLPSELHHQEEAVAALRRRLDAKLRAG